MSCNLEKETFQRTSGYVWELALLLYTSVMILVIYIYIYLYLLYYQKEMSRRLKDQVRRIGVGPKLSKFTFSFQEPFLSGNNGNMSSSRKIFKSSGVEIEIHE